MPEPSSVVGAAITAVASYLPERIVTNADLAQSLETSDEWIVTRTGIRERRRGAAGETTSMMGAEAVRRLMARRGLGSDDIDALIVATATPDMIFSATACLIQDQLGLRRACGFDLSAACSGFFYAMTAAAQLIAAGAHQRAVVVGADLMSSIIDPLDRTTAVLFGDGAGAALLEPAEPGFGSWILTTGSTAAVGRSCSCLRGAAFIPRVRRPLQHGSTSSSRMARLCSSLPWCLPHERVASVLARYGNTTGATLPMALDAALDEGKINRGDLVVFTAVGAGFTSGATLVRWS